ncbi:MAG TPA: protein translocase subunit SecF [Thermoanaerobaculia bacterium]|nr:protein translocase subunit SecF [Thermoanaerobaculia bacterium]
MQIFVNTNYDFVKYRWRMVIFSTLFVLAGLGVFFTKGINLGIDFSGGASITLKFQGTPPIGQLRGHLPESSIQQFGKVTDNQVLIRLPELKREGDYAGETVKKLHAALNPQGGSKLDLNFDGSDKIASLLQQRDPDIQGTKDGATHYKAISDKIIKARSAVGIFSNMSQVSSVEGVSSAVSGVLARETYLGTFNVLSQETVGPQVGSELQTKAMWAIILSSVAMGLYIWLRFDFTFGLAAVACIIHDVLVALAFLVMIRLEFSLNVVAGLLTVVGYSINDTVVMYDRVRENKRKIKKGMSLGEHMNLAINQTLSRTILTSGSVFLVLLALLAFGGEVIRGFSWILTIGVISGTFSTLYLVPAVAMWWENWRGNGATRATVPARSEAREETPQQRKRRSA